MQGGLQSQSIDISGPWPPATLIVSECPGRKRSPACCGASSVSGRQQSSVRARTGNVPLSEDAGHPLILVNHWQAANLQVFHVPCCLTEIIVLPTAMDAFRHHIARRHTTCIEAFLDHAFAYDVFGSYHADQPIIIAYWNSTYVVFLHERRDFRQGCIRTNPKHAFVHGLFDFHV
jgi:hypothetical protein